MIEYQCGGPANAIYGLGFLGAAIYFIKNATSFWNGVWGFVKAIFWPGILVYKAFELLEKKEAK